MRLVRGTTVLAVCLAAACSGTDEILPDPTDAAIDAQEWVEPPSPPPLGPEWALRAIEFLDVIENGLPDHLVDGHFPEGFVAPTPVPTCCAAGGVTLCQPNPFAWQGTLASPSLWDQLGNVHIDVPHAYVYSASSSGDALAVVAMGDLDCDGTIAELRMDCVVTSAVVTCTLSLPTLLD